MLKEQEKITIRNMIGSNGYGGEREKKKEKRKKNVTGELEKMWDK